MAKKKNSNIQYQEYEGPKLYPHQKAVVDEITHQRGTSKTVIVKAHRQAGKSFLCIGVLLYYAINHKATHNAMVSPTLNQSRQMFNELVNSIIDSGIIKKKNETLLELQLVNGSRIFFRSGEMKDGLRGYYVNGILILDEAAYLSDEVAQLVTPWVQVAKSPMLIVSTPKLKAGMFYNYYLMGKERQNNCVSIDWCDFDTSALLSKEQIETYRKILSPNQFKSDILGQFLDNDGMVFTNIDNCIGLPTNELNLYMGIDYGSGSGDDYTSITTFNNKGEMVDIEYFNNLGTFPQVERIAEKIKKYNSNLRYIKTEDNSIGKPLTDLLEKHLREQGMISAINKIHRHFTTNKNKAEMVALFQKGLELNEVKILNDSILKTQLSAYEATYNFKTNTITYNGAQGVHDDTVMSTLIAYSALKESETNAAYCIGSTRMNKRGY